MAIGQITNNNSNVQVSKKQQAQQAQEKEQNLWQDQTPVGKEGLQNAILMTINGKEMTAEEIELETQKIQQQIQVITDKADEQHKKVKSEVEQAIQEQENIAKEYVAFIENTINNANQRVNGASSEQERDAIASDMQDKVQERSGGFGPKAMKFISTLVDQIYGIAGIETGLSKIDDLGKELKEMTKVTQKEVTLPPSIQNLTAEVPQLNNKLDSAWGVFGTMVDTVVDNNEKAVDTIEQISGKPFKAKEQPGQALNQAA